MSDNQRYHDLPPSPPPVITIDQIIAAVKLGTPRQQRVLWDLLQCGSVEDSGVQPGYRPDVAIKNQSVRSAPPTPIPPGGSGGG